MNTRKNIAMLGILAAGLALLLSPGLAKAADFSADITASAIISDPENIESPRGLLKFDLPEDFSGKTVRSAMLFLSLSIPDLDSSRAEVAAWPVATAWLPDNVSWISPWQQPGGDVADSSYALYSTDDGSGRVIELDISTFASAWARGWYENNGLLLTLVRPQGRFFQFEGNQAWPENVHARVEMTYDD